MAPPPGPPPTISVQDSDNEPSKRNSRPVSIQFGSSLDSDYCKGLYDYEANGSDELSFKEDDVIHIISRSPNGMDDGWWMGELFGRTGIFPSIVVEECQANGDDWSPDVSLASPTHSIAPPCFSPPGIDAPPGIPPPQPFTEEVPSMEPPPSPPSEAPPSVSSVPLVTELTPEKIEQHQPVCPPTEMFSKTSTLDAPTMQIMITNPTPLVEHKEEPQDEKPVSYHVEDSSFSMKMSMERKEKYQNAVPVEVNVVEVDPQAFHNTVDQVDTKEVQSTPEKETLKSQVLLFNTEIMVTAPTPRVLSPIEPYFTCTSESESETAVVQDEVPNWANFGNATTETTEEESQGWANFGNSADQAVTDAQQSDNRDNKTNSNQQVESPDVMQPTKVNMPDIVPTTAIIKTPCNADDKVEVINTNLQKVTVGMVHAPSSSDTDDEPESDHKRRASNSSDTNSASGPEDTSTEMQQPKIKIPDIPLPPENLEPKQLKKLETMKESSA